jgi:hypothetical protein
VELRHELHHAIIEPINHPERFEALGLKQRGLLRSHPQAVERVHFTLFRDRMVVLDVGDRLLNATGPLCNGRQLCALRQPSAALRAAEPEIVRGGNKRVLHKRAAARKVSRLTLRVRSMTKKA